MNEPEIVSKGAAGNRLKAYKYKGHDVKEMRRQREEEGIQLRKQKKEQLVYIYVNILWIIIRGICNPKFTIIC